MKIVLIFILLMMLNKEGEYTVCTEKASVKPNNSLYCTSLYVSYQSEHFVGKFALSTHYLFYTILSRRYSDNQRSQDALNMTLFHWGVHAWVVYSLVGLCMAFATYRNNLPMTIRSCFYPLLGDWMYGIVGDIIDIISIVSTMFGVCTTLGLGAMTLNSGVNRVSSNVEESVDNQIIIIWVVTAMATISVITGLKVGVRRLSEVCFGLGVALMLIILFYDKTFFLLNLYVQSIGYYLQNFIQIGFHTEAFAQLGNAPDGRQAPQWIDAWTIFYWGWWISWSPFVGMFIARISRGRTIRSYINATLTAPILFSFLWFTIFGGAGLNMEREAALKGINCSDLLGGTNSTKPLGKLFRLSCRGESQMYFDVLQQYGDIGQFLNVLSLIAIVLYFVTSADSGSLVMDSLAANGNPDPPIVQRIFWAFTEGACATALLKVGGKSALKTIQTVSVAAGLPYALLVTIMCVSLWRALKEEDGVVNPSTNRTFNASLFDILRLPSWNNVVRFLTAVVAPWLPAGRAAGILYRKNPWSHMLIIAVLFYGWVILQVTEIVAKGLAYIGWVVICGFLTYLVVLRNAIREECAIPGSVIADGIVVILYPFAVDQLDKHMLIEEQQKKDDPKGTCFENKHFIDVQVVQSPTNTACTKL
jgi:choline/carnitine/betaine transport